KYDIAGDARTLVTPDPDNFLTPILYSSSYNASKAMALDKYPKAAEWDAMLDEARGVLNQDKAKPLYLKIQQWLQQELPIITLAYFSLPIVINKRVHNLDPGPMANL